MTATSLPEALTAADLSSAQRQTLIARFQALADDEIVLAQRGGEWTGHAPILEEDIALANIAQDELGHASLYLDLRRELDGSDPDRLAFFRDADGYRCARLVELPRGDWALTMLRQFLYDAAEVLWLDAAQVSRYAPLAGVAAKALREEKFHLQHSALWAERLGRGTPESARRAQAALDTLWPHAAQLFAPLPGEPELVAAGLLPDPDAVRGRWEALVGGHLRGRCDLEVPPLPAAGEGREVHTAYLAPLLAEMQAVARAHPGAGTW